VASELEQPDYTTMSGAEFQRVVGADPEKWAAAFVARYASADHVWLPGDREQYVARWFREAMDAARHDARTSSGAWRHGD
jgi:hypothetical protein